MRCHKQTKKLTRALRQSASSMSEQLSWNRKG